MMNLKQGRNTAVALALGAAVAFGGTNVAAQGYYNVYLGDGPLVGSFFGEGDAGEGQMFRFFETWYPGNVTALNSEGIETPAATEEIVPGFNYRDRRTGNLMNVQFDLQTVPNRPRRSVGVIFVVTLDEDLNPQWENYREIPARGRGAARIRETTNATYNPADRTVRYNSTETRVRAGYRVQGRLRKEGRVAIIGRTGRQVVTNTHEGVQEGNVNEPMWNVQVRSRLRRLSVANTRFNNVAEGLPIEWFVAHNDPAEITRGRYMNNRWNGPGITEAHTAVSTDPWITSVLPRKGVRYRLPNRRFSQYNQYDRLIARFRSPYGRVRTQNILVPVEVQAPGEAAPVNPVLTAMRNNDILTRRYSASAPGTNTRGIVNWTFGPTPADVD